MSTTDDLLFDVGAPEFRRDPYPAYRRLRERAPVFREPGGALLLTRRRECVALLSDPRWRYVEDVRCLPAQDAAGGGRDAAGTPGQAPDGHGAMASRPVRGPLSKVFTPRVVRGAQERIQQVAERLLDEALERGEVDLVEAYTYPLAATVFCELLGVPPSDRALFRPWVEATVRGIDAVLAITPEEATAKDRAGEAFDAYFRDLIARRRRRPGEDLISGLLQVEVDGRTLATDELVALCTLVLIAGHASTANFIASGTLALLRNPGELARLRDDPEVMPSAVEELLRYDPPGQFVVRRATCDHEFAGQRMQEGQYAVVFLAAANRDPEVFADPDRLDLTRSPNPHIAFSHGAHYCLGATLAREEARRALATLLRRAPGLALAGEPVYKPSLQVRGLQSLPVALR